MKMNVPPLPELPSLEPRDYEALRVWLGAFIQELEHLVEHLPTGSGTRRAYDPTNYTVKSDLNAGTAVVADVANVLCTLLFELKQSGRIS